MKKVLILFVSVIFVFALVASAEALYFTVEDSAFDVVYGLTMLPVAGDNTMSVTFQITPNLSAATTPETYDGAYLWKFDTDVKGDISALSGPTGSTGSWSVADGTLAEPNVNILWAQGNYQPLLENGFSGIYLDSLVGGADDFTQGVALTEGGGPFTASFQVSLPVGYSFRDTTIPFKALRYTDTPTGQVDYKFTQLSTTLAVPEPATLFLLGSGLVGLGAFGRRKRRKS